MTDPPPADPDPAAPAGRMTEPSRHADPGRVDRLPDIKVRYRIPPPPPRHEAGSVLPSYWLDADQRLLDELTTRLRDIDWLVSEVEGLRTELAAALQRLAALQNEDAAPASEED